MNTHQTHERLSKIEGDPELPSERSFAITFAAVFLLVALVPLVHGGSIRLWSVGGGAIFLVLAYLAPSILRPLNVLWFKLGLLLHKIVNPIILGAMFFLAITPMAFLMRAFGKTFLNLPFETNASTYWIDRVPPGPNAESVRRQF
ncbi:MAG TPA: SxtJ family membrane protein [Aestuariivirga sp.]|nr:SxtJ family membrane protein [Aestuariivirga sp.]